MFKELVADLKESLNLLEHTLTVDALLSVQELLTDIEDKARELLVEYDDL